MSVISIVLLQSERVTGVCRGFILIKVRPENASVLFLIVLIFCVITRSFIIALFLGLSLIN